MLTDPQVSLQVVTPGTPDVPAQALARIKVLGRPAQYAAETEGHAVAKAAYLARFPQSGDLFGFADFSLLAIWPDSIRFVGGFAQARTLTPQTLAEVLREG